MSKPFDMEPFLSGVLTGSHTTRQRHLRQAKTIQAAIVERWQRDNPWTWQRKHLIWFLDHRLNQQSEATRYYYVLTMQSIAVRLIKSWKFKKRPKPCNRPKSKGRRGSGILLASRERLQPIADGHLKDAQ